MSTGSELYDLLAKTNATLNPNNTITLRFNDGSSYTTGVIKDGPELSPADKAMEEAKEASTISQAAMEEANKAAIAAGNAEQSASEAAASATNAENFASEAQQSASTASTAATNAETSASNAATSASNAATNAQAAATSASAAEGSAQTAATEAAEAKTSATNASEYASRALGNLSTVQSVTETLNWITAHGTMTLTSDTALDPSHVYFILDPNGDYMVSGNKYRVVTEPKVADIATYYELSIDESLNNYVATHLAVDSEGLWILPDSGGNKVLIATGQGQTYTAAGTYIVSGSDILAEFTANGAQIGQDSESHLNMDYHSMQLIDKEGDPYFYVSDLRDRAGNLIEEFNGDGSTATFKTAYEIVSVVKVEVDDVETTDYTVDSLHRTYFTLTNAPADGSIVRITYQTSEGNSVKAYTLGTRQGATGLVSYAMGANVEASGVCSFAEGVGTKARKGYSHAEGYSTQAEQYAHAEGESTVAATWGHAEGNHTSAGVSAHAEGTNAKAHGQASHAQNYYTLASSNYQTALGKYNEEDTADTYALIIGNGTSNNARSNALTVDWQGNVKTAGSVTENNGTRDIDLQISETTIQKYVNLGMSTT